jgi:hypothetical protein
MNYVEAMPVAEGYKGRVYRYNESGNKPIVVCLLSEVKSTKEEAIDDAVEWCDEHDLECEIDFG